MSKRKQLSREIGHSLLTWSKKVTERSIIRHVYDAKALTRQRIARVMAGESIQQYEILRVRSDGRCVAKAIHPEFGNVVVKSGTPSRNPAMAYTNLHVARIVQATGNNLFPVIYRAELGFTVEEWVEGREVSKLEQEAIRVGYIEDLLERLKNWSLANATGQAMWEEDIQDTIVRYVRTILDKQRRKSNGGIVLTIHKLYRNRQQITERLAYLQHLASEVHLPHCMALQDLGLVNLMLDKQRSSFLVIDHERAMLSHYGFDAAYILRSLHKKNLPAHALSALEAYAFSSEYVGSEEAAVFFRTLYETLNDLSNAVS